MTSTDHFEATIAEWLDAESAYHLPDHLGEVVAQTAVTRQRPAWSSLERWLPMQTTLRLAPAPRLGWLLVIALALIAVSIATLAVLSTRQRPAPPFGPARNGALVYERDGDILRIDPSTGLTATIASGPEKDIVPYFSRDGLSVAFHRQLDDGHTVVMVAGADGSDVRAITGPLAGWTWTDWSIDGSRLAISTSEGGTPSITIANADGSGVRTLDLGMPATFAGWTGADGSELAFIGHITVDGEPRIALFAVRADGSGLRRLSAPMAPTEFGDPIPSASLDGRRVAFQSFDDARWRPFGGPGDISWAGDPWSGTLSRIHVVDMATGSEIIIPNATDPTDPSQPVHQFRPTFSPDGQLVVFPRSRSDGTLELAIARSDGSDPGHRIGPVVEPSLDDAPWYEFSPDGTLVIASYPGEHAAHLLPVDGAEGSTIPGSRGFIPSMQRLAP